MEYEWIFEEGVVYGSFCFLGVCILVAFYRADDIHEHLEN